MITTEMQHLLDKAEDSHAAAKVLIEKGFIGFSAAQSYYTIFIWLKHFYCQKSCGFRATLHLSLRTARSSL